MTIRSVSYGGGVQSTALLVLAAASRIDFPSFLFANTGDDSENPATLRYVRVDEIERASAPGVNRSYPSQFRVFPLLDLGFHRSDCRKTITDAGLPIPPKSSCFFCPFHDREAWRHQKRETPALFAKSAEVERRYQQKLARHGRRPQWLTRHGRPLIDVVDDQQTLFGDDCESGWCFT